jgi:hypothetical protein
MKHADTSLTRSQHVAIVFVVIVFVVIVFSHIEDERSHTQAWQFFKV